MNEHEKRQIVLSLWDAVDGIRKAEGVLKVEWENRISEDKLLQSSLRDEARRIKRRIEQINNITEEEE